MMCIPQKNGCALECETCEMMQRCEFRNAILKKIKQIQINIRARTKRVNARYGYNTENINRDDLIKLFRKTILGGCVCTYCGREMFFPSNIGTSLWAVSLEHIIPLSDGGTNELSNLTLCHTGCNHDQNKKTLLRKNGIQ